MIQIRYASTANIYYQRCRLASKTSLFAYQVLNSKLIVPAGTISQLRSGSSWISSFSATGYASMPDPFPADAAAPPLHFYPEQLLDIPRFLK